MFLVGEKDLPGCLAAGLVPPAWHGKLSMLSPEFVPDMPSAPLLRLDFQWSQYLYKNVGKHTPSWLLEALELSGHGLFWIPAVLLVTLWPNINWKIRICALNLVVSFILDLLLVGACKMAVRRPRPSYPERQYNATIIADKYSFPSGHASRCILIAAMLCTFRPLCNVYVVVAMVVWAVVTTMSRVLLGRHYVLDVVIGGLLGVLIAGLMTQVSPYTGLPFARPVKLATKCGMPNLPT
jgi:presqualene diphosphate phosphatase